MHCESSPPLWYLQVRSASCHCHLLLCLLPLEQGLSCLKCGPEHRARAVPPQNACLLMAHRNTCPLTGPKNKAFPLTGPKTRPSLSGASETPALSQAPKCLFTHRPQKKACPPTGPRKICPLIGPRNTCSLTGPKNKFCAPTGPKNACPLTGPKTRPALSQATKQGLHSHSPKNEACPLPVSRWLGFSSLQNAARRFCELLPQAPVPRSPPQKARLR